MGVIKYDDWEYATGKGWISLINEAINLINKFNEEHPNLEFPVHIVDVKEKWGILQIDLDFYYKDLQEQILRICLRSRNICEFCGETKDVKTLSIHGWTKTLCTKCKEDEEKEFNNFIKKINES